MSDYLDEPFYDKSYEFNPGDIVYNKLTGEKCGILRQLPIKGDDVGMAEKYYVRRPCGRKSPYYGVELSKTEPTNN